VPTAIAAGVADLEIVVDTRERYADGVTSHQASEGRT